MTASDDLAALRRSATRLLGDVWSGVALADDVEVLDTLDEFPTVARLRPTAPSDAPPAVVVKRPGRWAAYDPNAAEGPAVTFFNDWAGLTFLGPPLAPRLLAADREAGLLVMEDLGTGPSLADHLLGDDPSGAEAVLLAFARALGAMHAVTLGRRDEYAQLRDALGPGGTSGPWLKPSAVGGFSDACASIGVALPAAARDRLEAAMDGVRAGPFDAYTHRDPCPDNTRIVSGEVRLFDFAFGGYGSALLDGVFGRLPFPTCWCLGTLPDELPGRMEAAYRDELATGSPQAWDDATFGTAATDAWLFWLMWTTGYRLEEILETDEIWGIATRRQRLLLRWELFAVQAADRAPELADVAEDLLRAFAARWPDVTRPTVYPAWREAE